MRVMNRIHLEPYQPCHRHDPQNRMSRIPGITRFRGIPSESSGDSWDFSSSSARLLVCSYSNMNIEVREDE